LFVQNMLIIGIRPAFCPVSLDSNSMLCPRNLDRTGADMYVFWSSELTWTE
jgi:hypothetical protein